ncbi:MAG TPA: GGDEF domain-containing protein [Thermoanaerobaculia bacterium]
MGFLARLLELLARPGAPPPPPSRPLDFAHVLDLVRRACGGVAAWAVGLREGDLQVGSLGPGDDRRNRGAALVQLASADGRTHTAPDTEGGGTFVAVGDFPYGAGVLLGEGHAAQQAAVDDLRRLVAGMRLAERDVLDAPAQLVARQLAVALSGAGAQTLEAVARAAAELAEQLSQRGAAIVLPQTGGGAQVIAISPGADKRLAGLVLQPVAPAARAIEQGLPVVTQAGEDVFGSGSPQRRRQERGGAAYPLVDGRAAVGALVLIGAPLAGDAPGLERIGRLVAELGPRFAAARAVYEAEQRAIRDPLTGLSNRREFEQVLGRYRGGGRGGGPAPPATLVYVDLDRFKRLNDSLGHAAGDSALRHVARLLEAAVRDGDLVARIGGEEFAVWLPRTPLAEGLEVAERIRHSVANTTWQWSGSPYPLTTSCGVAAYPEPIGDLSNLRTSADAALYRAKQAGRNRVEMAVAGR